MAGATALSIGPDVLTITAQPQTERDSSVSSFQMFVPGGSSPRNFLEPAGNLKRQPSELQEMIIRDADTGFVMWQASSESLQRAGPSGDNSWQLTATLSSSILAARSVSRELTFATTTAITHLHVIQDVLVHGTPVEQWSADFGFVIPNSVNSWSHSVDAADPEDMLPVDVLSGNTMIETRFMDGETALAALSIRLFYE
ncbi:hypothetical protein HDU86_007254 [Geranomyces michiganensis]|nr:hypothetical protein HDU86_007254 [Geranomyces michiganensis]